MTLPLAMLRDELLRFSQNPLSRNDLLDTIDNVYIPVISATGYAHAPA